MPSPPSERRVVTVVFADIPGWADATAALSPDAARTLLDEAFQVFRDAIESAGGFVDKFVGEGVMAVFGAPVARGEDALRAVRAALAMRDGAAALGAARGVALAARAGVNTGEVLWGSVGGDRPTAMGDPVNVAQRLLRAAAAGQVLAGPATTRQLDRRVRGRPRGPLEVKGREEPVEAWEALNEDEALTEVRAAAPAPFVGREAELASLLDRLGSGHGGFVWVEGEAGVGKSRLLAEFRREARARNAGWVAYGRALESARLPLGPFGDLARAAAGVTGLADEDGPRIASAVEADLAGALPDVRARETAAHLVASSLGCPIPGSRARDIDPARLAGAVHAAWARWLRSRAPAVLSLEDLHWADAPTRELLAALAQSLAADPVLFVATSRPGPPPPAGFEPLPLHEIPESASELLAAAALGAAPAPELARFLFEKSGGNPLFLEELAHYLRDGGLLEGSPARLRVPPDRLPAGLQGLLVARLDALPAPSREALKAASVAGRAFWPALVAHLSGPESPGALDEPRRRGLVLAQGGSLLPGEPQLAFRHALLRDAAYSLLPKKDRARFHALAAGFLEARLAGAGRRGRALAAAHRRAAGEVEAAVRLWLEASAEAMAESVGEAVEWAREARATQRGAATCLAMARALAAAGRTAEALAEAGEAARCEDATVADRARARLQEGRLRLVTGPHAAALELADEALAAAPGPEVAAEARLVRAKALDRLGRHRESKEECARVLAAAPPAAAQVEALQELAAAHISLAEDREALAAFEEALALARRAGGRRTEAAILNNRAFLRFEHGDTAGALADYAQVEALYRDSGDRLGQARSLANAARIRMKTGETREAIRAFGEALEVARDCADRNSQAAIWVNLGAAHTRLGEFRESRRANEEALRIARELGDPEKEASALNNLGMALDCCGEFREALAAYGAALEIRRRTGDSAGAARALNNLGIVHAAQGRLGDAVAAHREALRLAREAGKIQLVAESQVNLGDLLQATGEPAAARAALDEALQAFRTTGDRMSEAEALDALARLRAAEGDLEAAEDTARRALAIAVSVSDRRGEARTLLTLGKVLSRRGEFGEATANIREAVRFSAELGDRPGEARALHALGGLQADQGEYDAALETLGRSRALAEQSGHRPLMAEALEWIARIRHYRGDRAGARAACEEGLAIARAADDPRRTAAALVTRAQFESAEGRAGEAAAGFEEARRLQESAGDLSGLASTLHGLGELARNAGEVERSLALLRRALEIFCSLGNRYGVSTCLSSLGSTLADAGRREEAADALRESLETKRRLGEIRGLATALVNLAATLRSLGRFHEAEPHARAALEEFRRLGHVRGVAHTARTLGEILAARGQPEAAATLLQQALDAARASGFAVEEVAALLAQSMAADCAGDAAGAVARAGEAVAAAGGKGAEALIGAARADLAWALALAERGEEAMRAATEALEALDRRPDAAARVVALLALALARPDGAEAALAEAEAALVESRRTFTLRLQTLRVRARLAALRGDVNGAQRLLGEGAARALEGGAEGIARTFRS